MQVGPPDPSSKGVGRVSRQQRRTRLQDELTNGEQNRRESRETETTSWPGGAGRRHGGEREDQGRGEDDGKADRAESRWSIPAKPTTRVIR